MKIRKIPVFTLALLLFLVLAVSRLEQGREEQDIRQLEEALRRSAVACFASEGMYPADVAYLCEHYGLTYDESRYVVHYQLTASNFMPDITVTER